MSDQPYCHYPQCGCPNKKSKSDCFKGYPLEGSMTAPSETSQELQCICKLMWAQGAYPEFHCDKHGFMQTNRHAIDAIVEAACLRNELQAALAESRAECERLREQVYVPGVWKCAKCKMELVASILAVSSSSIHADNRPQECPNNCGPMWRITERDQRKEAQALHEKEFMRAQAAETREREAYERAAQLEGSIKTLESECNQLNDMVIQNYAVIDNLASMCRRLSYSVKRSGNDRLAHECVELLKKHDLGGSVIRTDALSGELREG